MRIIEDSNFVTIENKLRALFQEENIQLPLDLVIKDVGVKSKRSLLTHLSLLRKSENPLNIIIQKGVVWRIQ